MFKSLTQQEREEIDTLRHHQEARRDHELAHARVRRHTEALVEAEDEREEASVERGAAKAQLDKLLSDV